MKFFLACELALISIISVTTQSDKPKGFEREVIEGSGCCSYFTIKTDKALEISCRVPT